MQGSERVQKHLQMQSSLLMRSTGSLPVLSKYSILCLLGEANYRSANSLLFPKHLPKRPQAAVWEQKQALVNFYTPLLPRCERKRYNVGNFQTVSLCTFFQKKTCGFPAFRSCWAYEGCICKFLGKGFTFTCVF